MGIHQKEGYLYLAWTISIRDSVSCNVLWYFQLEIRIYRSTQRNWFYSCFRWFSVLEMIISVKVYNNSGVITWNFANLKYEKPKRLCILIDKPLPPDTISIDIIRRDIDSVTYLAGKRDNENIGHFIVVKK